MWLVSRMREWRAAAVTPRLEILRLLPVGGPRLVIGLALINLGLGLLPIVFIVETSAIIGYVPRIVQSGVDSAAWHAWVRAFLLAAVAFLGQQVLTALRGVLDERIKARIDGQVRDRIMFMVMKPTTILLLEESATLDALGDATRQLQANGYTPGAACAGLVALIAPYTRLAALLVLVSRLTSWPLALALGSATLLFRYGQRGGLRKYAACSYAVSGLNRRLGYLRELGMGSAAAKELRVFGLVDWLTEKFAQAYLAANAPIALRRREVYLAPFLFYTTFGMLVATGVLVTMARAGTVGLLSLSELSVGFQAVTAAMLLGQFYPESDVQTQYGMQALTALSQVRTRIEAASIELRVSQIDCAKLLPFAPSLRFENVSFGYPRSDRAVFDGFNLELPAGQCTAIVGVNGAGKSTLVKLLARLYEPDSGRIWANGVDIGALRPTAWRRQLSAIFQDFIRYELSAAENIALGAAHLAPNRAAIERAAARAGILEELDAHPLGLDSPLSRAYIGGIDLSGGQWQRLAIARSLYALEAGARVLIWDEPTSALDVRAEVAFFDRLLPLTRGVTTILISHRLSSVRRADRIVVIDAGRVVEAGTHAELMTLDGQYATLFRLQADRFLAEPAAMLRSQAELGCEPAAE